VQPPRRSPPNPHRWSGSPDEAEDAVERALEIYARRLATIDRATELAWLKVVVLHSLSICFWSK
jgi:hypothetical protein